MIALLRTFFFVIGSIFGYYVVSGFYHDEPIHAVNHLIKKEKPKLEKKRTEERTKEINYNEPDPLIDNVGLTELSYAIYGFFHIFAREQIVKKDSIYFSLRIFYEKIKRFLRTLRFNDQTAKEWSSILSSFLPTFVLAFFFKIGLSLFSSLVFKVHGFWWNLFEAYNLKFYFSWYGLINFFLNIMFLAFGLTLTDVLLVRFKQRAQPFSPDEQPVY